VPDEPTSAGIWNYWMGGTDNTAADRAFGDEVASVYPEAFTLARQCRLFSIRAVRYLAGEAGVRQFLDVGTGLPTVENTHETAQGVAPDAAVVYVDNDPLVIEHGRRVLTAEPPRGPAWFLPGDLRDPVALLADAGELIDLREPVAVLLMGVLGHFPDVVEAKALIRTLLSGLAPGSHLAFYTATSTSEQMQAGSSKERDAGVLYALSAVSDLESLVAGLELVEPGLVPVSLWRPPQPAEPIDAYGVVARI
jgi:hypothetical protein